MSKGWWELIFLMLVMKLPIAYLSAVVWWAVKAEPRPLEGAARLVELEEGHELTADLPALWMRIEGFLAAQLLHTDVDSAWQALRADDPRQELEAVRSPVLVLWGAEDVQLPLDDAFEYTRRLRARLRVIPGCGHLLIGERPEACEDAIERFLGDGSLERHHLPA